jgi:hypothetical protein
MGRHRFPRLSFRSRARGREASAAIVDAKPEQRVSKVDLVFAALTSPEIVVAAGRYLEWVDELPGVDEPPGYDRRVR